MSPTLSATSPTFSTLAEGYDINDLYQEAQTRWLKPPEVLFILQNHEKHQLTEEPPKQPTSGSLFLFNQRDGRTVGEAHERLKVGNVEALNCYYAHGEHNPNFQRRSYWMLDQTCDHIVLVHYRDISEGKPGTEVVPQLSLGSASTLSSNTSQNLASTSDFKHTSSSPGSVEVSSNTGNQTNGIADYEISELIDSNGFEVSQALRGIEEQLSFNEDSLKDIGPFYSHEEVSNSDLLDYYYTPFKMQESGETYDQGNAVVEPIVVTIPSNERMENPERNNEDKSWGLGSCVVVGGLIESITSLVIVTSAATANISQGSVMALALTNLISGLVIIRHSVPSLEKNKKGCNAIEVEQERSYKKIWRDTMHYLLHFAVVAVSLLFFGSVPPLVYAFSFPNTGNRILNIIAAAGASLPCIAFLAILKAHIGKPDSWHVYVKTGASYLLLGIGSFGLSYLAGDTIGKLID